MGVYIDKQEQYYVSHPAEWTFYRRKEDIKADKNHPIRLRDYETEIRSNKDR
jgi:hypothetical protein